MAYAHRCHRFLDLKFSSPSSRSAARLLGLQTWREAAGRGASRRPVLDGTASTSKFPRAFAGCSKPAPGDATEPRKATGPITLRAAGHLLGSCCRGSESTNCGRRTLQSFSSLGWRLTTKPSAGSDARRNFPESHRTYTRAPRRPRFLTRSAEGCRFPGIYKREEIATVVLASPVELTFFHLRWPAWEIFTISRDPGSREFRRERKAVDGRSRH